MRATAGARLAAALLVASAASAAEAPGFPSPGPRARCPVCGMFVARCPDWLAAAVFRDGSHELFDGPKDLFKFYLEVERYAPARTRVDVRALYVTDYYSVRPVAAPSAFYVLGSDVFGPMGRELVPFEREADAREFQRDHRGREVVRFADVTAAMLRDLDGGAP